MSSVKCVFTNDIHLVLLFLIGHARNLQREAKNFCNGIFVNCSYGKSSFLKSLNVFLFVCLEYLNEVFHH